MPNRRNKVKCPVCDSDVTRYVITEPALYEEDGVSQISENCRRCRYFYFSDMWNETREETIGCVHLERFIPLDDRDPGHGRQFAHRTAVLEETRRMWADRETWELLERTRAEGKRKRKFSSTDWLVVADWLSDRGYQLNEATVRAVVKTGGVYRSESPAHAG